MNKPEKKGLVPVLRFPKFRDAEEWVRKPLGEIGEILQGYGFPEVFQGKTKGEFPFYKVSDISKAILNGSHFIDKAVNYVDTDDLALIRAKTIPAGTTIFAKIGEAIRSNRRALTTSECLIDNNVAGVKAIHGKANDFYIFYVLSQINLIEYSGGTVPSINKTTLENIPVFSTQPEEQKKIADCLTSIDELIIAQTQKLDAFETHKKGLMQQLFPADGETVPKRRFPEFRGDGEWEQKPLSTLVKSLDAGVSVNSGDRPANKNERGILKTSAVTSGIFDSSENKIVTDTKELSRLKEPVLKNTIIISRMNTPALVGANAYIEASHENLFLPDRLWAAKPKSGTSMRFIAYILGGGQGRAALSALATGTSGSMKNISKSAVLEVQISTPSTEEQQKIADCLTSIDKLITAQTQKLGTLKTYKKGLIKQLFPAMDEVSA
ncbi:restriction endonuclease subunit S [Pseudomonas fluorescens]|uniref:restriction endonuclease subunit S n=1 Tax=Pseudomonas fluorescens TaxID=294 RepID=UPI000AB87E27|nr:restriction endonuclease subunit S [Pseudomonas fluorescens]